ncbi:MAG: hypothetical protein EON98_13085 [Chitinophagaceae bacterium]|nr:MAG: hypothetical protein EON98_13085 [Chitinophagaceae bacterium]
MKKTLLLLLVASAFVACQKNKFETVPQINIKSFGPDVVVKGQTFRLVAEITDKEGDLQDSVLLVRKRFTNGTIQVPATRNDSSYVNLSQFGFPNTPTIQFEINFAYGEQLDGFWYYEIQEQVDRGVKYEITITDKEKNKSQTVETKMITLKKV